jgi:hypothetical protein
VADHILDGFRAGDQHRGLTREVFFNADGQILTVAVRDSDSGDYEEQHFRLVEVQQQWVEIKKPWVEVDHG